MYISFEEYEELGGTIADEVTFNRLEYESRMDVDLVTNQRLIEYSAAPGSELQPFEALKRCMFELIEDALITMVSKEQAKKYGGELTSISNDGYSVSIARRTSETPGTGNNTLAQSQRCQLIQRYLPDYSYRGVPWNG